jgi:hypothetical protein
MSNQFLEVSAWVLIYAGAVLAALGLFVPPEAGGWGQGLVSVGLLALVAGVVCIVVRARRAD